MRVLTAGYDANANCQFPNELKREGAVYVIRSDALRRCGQVGRKAYYRVVTRDIQVKTDDAVTTERAKSINRLDVFRELECVVCMDQESQVIFRPCGHFVCCGDCAIQLLKCPMCSLLITDWATADDT